MNFPSSGNSTLQGPQVTPQKCTSVGRPACERSISLPASPHERLELGRRLGCRRGGQRDNQEYGSQQLAFHDPSPIGSRRYPSALVIQER